MTDTCAIPGLTEDDVLDAMRSMQGYVDITPGTFREIYELAYDHAVRRMRGLRRAGEIMTTPVHCLRRDMSAAEAAAFLAGHGIAGAPVLDGRGLVCGVVSEKDFLRRMGLSGMPSFMNVIARCLTSSGCLVSNLKALALADLMSSPAVVASETASVAEISELFAKHGINRLPICDGEGRPVGIVTRGDLVGSMCLGG